jgi:hypothetical protein
MDMPRFEFDGKSMIPASEAPDQDLRSLTIGYRWVASRGTNDCPQCAALHDKEFYYKPKLGQASVAEMPKGQLHPNCDCTKVPITELTELPSSDPVPKPYMEGKVKAKGGFLFRASTINSLGIAPVYGRY